MAGAARLLSQLALQEYDLKIDQASYCLALKNSLEISTCDWRLITERALSSSTGGVYEQQT